MNKYNIHVYKIWWDNKDDLYVGCTKQSLSIRMAGHRKMCKGGTQYRLYNAMRVNGLDFRYVLLQSYEVSSRDEKRKWEQHHIDLLNPNLNKIRAYNTPEDNKRMLKQYKEEHKNEKRIADKNWRENNKDRKKANDTKYYRNNKIEIR